jgi:hypothetical protein
MTLRVGELRSKLQQGRAILTDELDIFDDRRGGPKFPFENARHERASQ